MNSLYKVEYDGKEYVGNVLLHELHLFQKDGQFYVYNVDKKSACTVSACLASKIRSVDSSFGGLILESSFNELEKLGLTIPDDNLADAQQIAPSSEKKDELAVTRIALFVAQECNMACVYCYGNEGEYGAKGMMTEETAFRTVDWLIENSKKAKDIYIGFFGGEPLLNFPLIESVVTYAKEKSERKGKQVHFNMTTNGSVLTDRILAFLRDENIDITVSFDGSAEYQNQKRPFKGSGKGSYDTVLENVKRLQQEIPNVTARATVCSDMDASRVKAGIQDAGFKNYNLVAMSPSDFGQTRDSEQIDKQLANMKAYHQQEAKGLLSTIKNRQLDPENIPGLLQSISELDSGKKLRYACGVGKSLAGISSTGDVYPCHRFVGHKEFRLGNVVSHKVEENAYWRAMVDSLPDCSSCWARHLCGGGCAYHNQALTGNTFKPDESFCEQTRDMFEGLITLYCELSAEDRDYLSEVTGATASQKCCGSKCDKTTA
jgi:uncharacterized protein